MISIIKQNSGFIIRTGVGRLVSRAIIVDSFIISSIFIDVVYHFLRRKKFRILHLRSYVLGICEVLK